MTADDPRALEFFTCEHFRCSLTKKACLRRQGARRRLRNGTTETVKPVHERCGSGSCAQGNEIRAELGEAPVELVNRPKPPAPVEEDVVMARKEPTKKLHPKANGAMTDRLCKCGCGRPLRVNNTSGYSGYCNRSKYAAGGRAKRRPSIRKASPSRRRGPRIVVRELDGEELLARRDELLLELADVDEQLRARLASEEAKLERLREAVGAAMREPPAERQEAAA